jgi:hypothetical protein
MSKLNCWEYTGCERGPGGSKVSELGVCPAGTAVWADGVHGGHAGGRSCWAIVGTLCDGEVQHSYASKLHRCVGCSFYERVHEEEDFLLPPSEIVRRCG